MSLGLFYNKEKLGDILYVVIKGNEIPNLTKKIENCMFLYKNNDLIGVNIFEFSKFKLDKYFLKFSKNMIVKYDLELIKQLNILFKKYDINQLDENNFSGFKIGQVIEIEEHPDSEHLHICKVDVGNETLQIVCGARNVKKDMKVVVALPFTHMINGSQIIPNKLLGIESNGMLCSGKELGINGYENIRGLLEIDDTYNIGDDFWR